MSKVVIKFETEEKANAFIGWFCNSGEQDYFTSQKDSEQPMVNRFSYDFKNNIIKEEN